MKSVACWCHIAIGIPDSTGPDDGLLPCDVRPSHLCSYADLCSLETSTMIFLRNWELFGPKDTFCSRNFKMAGISTLAW